MAHLSLYRKFRPAAFDQIVRQEHVVRVLRNQIERGEVGHAYLFCGPRGTGKTSVARIFARAVNCEHPVNGSPCGECAVCRALAGNSLDIAEIDAASNNGVNEMRDLREKVQYPPVSGRYKVYIVDEVHMLTDSAFNALLKTLEEPPAHALFILATTEPHKIPATILSRCMRLDFKLIPEEDLERHLSAILREIGKPCEPEAVAAIARAGAGSDRDMLSIAEMCLAYGDALTYEAVTAVLGTADFRTTARLVGAMLAADMPQALAEAEAVLAEGKSVGVLLRDVLTFLNQTAIAKTCARAERMLSLPKEMFAAVRAVADAADGAAILRATELFAKAETDMRYSSSPRIVFETALMRVSMPQADRDVQALLVRLNALEAKMAAGEPAPQARAGENAAAPSVSREQPSTPQAAEKSTAFYRPSTDEPPPLGDAPPFDDAPPWEEPPTVRPPLRGRTNTSAPQARAGENAAAPSVSREQPSTPQAAEKSTAFYRPSTDEPPPLGDAPPFDDAPPWEEPPTVRPPLRGRTNTSAPQALAGENAAAPSVSREQSSTPQAADGDGARQRSPEETFGLFLRRLRKLPKSGVLYALCRDLESRCEDGKMVLTTDIKTICDSLNGEHHRAVMEQVFSELGIAAFEVRYVGSERREEQDGLTQLKKDFSDYPIEIK